ncbi:MAG TPA: autotransporter-associated beta strand repeat-containing protein, partial [Verrucomicrobiae bacterium]|nr:autotransporter-associated beta strand repeat-containing protein [Verrucomicrobiae bacterium]
GVITNVGQLYFSPFFTQGHGIYNLTGGSIYIGSGGITVFAGGGYELNLGGGTVGAEASWVSALNLTLTGSNGPVNFDTAGSLIMLSGVLSGPGGLTVSGGGTLELSGANTYTGDTLVTAGSTLQLDSTGSSAGALGLADRAFLNLNFGGNYVVGSLYTNGVALPVGSYNAGTLPGFIVGSGEVQVSSGISTGLWTGGGADDNWSSAGNWDNHAVPVFPHALTFAGHARLTNNNDLADITVSSLTFDAAAGAFVLGGSDITLTGGLGFNGDPATPVTQSINLGMTWTANQTLNTPTNGNLTLGGAINSASSLTKTGAGTLTLGGVDYFSGCIANGGTTVISGNVTISGTSGSFVFLGNADTNYNGTLVIQPGATLTVAGDFDDAMVIGRDGGSGRVIQNGGTFSYSNPSHAYLFVGATSHVGTQAAYDMNGGVLDLNGETLGLALGDAGVTYTATLTQAGGAINNVFNLDLGSVRAYGRGVYTLGGGTITIDSGGITSSSGSYGLNLGGGTVAASTSWSSSLDVNLTNLNGSVTFDTAGNTIALSGVLSGNGGLIVTGSGVLELAATNTYTGDTLVNQGTLQLDAPGSLPSALRLVDGAYLNLNFAGSLAVTGFYTNGVALPVGSYNASNLPGFILGTGDLQVAGLAFTTQPQNQVVYLNHGQSATLTSAVVGGTATYQWYLNGNPVSGATNSSLALSGLQITDGGNFYVVVTGTAGSVTSSVAAVTIYAVNNHVFVYDGFGYDVGSVDGASQAGGFGWDGPWQQTDGNGVLITTGNLQGGVNVPAGYDSRSISNCIEVPSNAQTRSGRFFDCSTNSALYKQGFIDAHGNVGADGKTVYLGLLQQPDRTSGFYEFEFHRGNLSDPGRIGGIGNDAAGNNVNLRAPNGVNDRSLGAGTAAVNFYVVRIDYKAGNDDVFVYRNPSSTSEPATPTLTVSNVADLSFNGVSVAAYNGPDVKHDEIRLGATYEDALGLAVSNLLPPEPSANGRRVRFAATPGFSYHIQRAGSVAGPWSDIGTVVCPENGSVDFEDVNPPADRAFYRTVTP